MQTRMPVIRLKQGVENENLSLLRGGNPGEGDQM